jgi:hypothetical protein
MALQHFRTAGLQDGALTRRSRVPFAAALALAIAGASLLVSAQTPAYRVPRTPDGHPDLQGVWDYRTATPLERPAIFQGKEFLTDADVADYERRTAARADGRQLEDPRTDPSVQSPDWLDYGRRVVASKRSSLIIGPTGRIPALTADAQTRETSRRAAGRGRGPADDPENRSLWERCITRGFPDGVLPAGYNNNIEIVQTRTHVVVLMEMIHDARIVPIDGRAHLPSGVTQWMGDPRGRWDGDTLVVETSNFSGKVNFKGATDRLHVAERFTRTGPDTIEYRITVTDPTTWTSPWTVELPLVRYDERVYEYACHEGNHGLRNILSQARALERTPSSK